MGRLVDDECLDNIRDKFSRIRFDEHQAIRGVDAKRQTVALAAFMPNAHCFAIAPYHEGPIGGRSQFPLLEKPQSTKRPISITWRSKMRIVAATAQ